jgi:hypothetical protein
MPIFARVWSSPLIIQRSGSRCCAAHRTRSSHELGLLCCFGHGYQVIMRPLWGQWPSLSRSVFRPPSSQSQAATQRFSPRQEHSVRDCRRHQHFPLHYIPVALHPYHCIQYRATVTQRYFTDLTIIEHGRRPRHSTQTLQISGSRGALMPSLTQSIDAIEVFLDKLRMLPVLLLARSACVQ